MPELIKSVVEKLGLRNTLDLDEFESAVRHELSGLDTDQRRHFAWLCAVRVCILFRLSMIVTNYWPFD
ncbi:hypothetical protein ACFL2V_13925, partial [Pseudomonadota bacterium]